MLIQTFTFNFILKWYVATNLNNFENILEILYVRDKK